MKTGRGLMLNDSQTLYKEEVQQQQQHHATERILMQVAGFTRHELPIRLAHRIVDLDRVPFLRDMPSVQAVKDIYIHSFLELLHFSTIENPTHEAKFARKLESLYDKHSNVLVQMARGAYELRSAVRNGKIPGLVPSKNTGNIKNQTSSEATTNFEQMDELHKFLDRFYMSRIGIRVLAGQYLSLRHEPMDNYVGMICQTTSPLEVVQHASDDASLMCARKYGDAPEIIITGRLDLTFPYVPTHLHYIVLELLKNAMRATVEKHGVDSQLPPVQVVIADGTENEDVVIKVADEGGGIPRSHMKKIWSYLFTTADPSIQDGAMATFPGGNGVDHSVDSPLAGLGYGLPISRSYARYFGGDMKIMSMEGYGTDAFVYLKRLGNSREPLPVF
jgi:pyruvate dehydrogenase kinase 2/3/4